MPLTRTVKRLAVLLTDVSVRELLDTWDEHEPARSTKVSVSRRSRSV
jgi:hypothetical protein